MALKALSGVTQGASSFTRLPNGFTRSSKLTQTLPIDGVNKASIRVVIGTTAVGTGVFNRSATAGVTIGVSASGQQTDQQHYGTATVGVVISSTASASVTSTHSGTATASIVITTTAAGETGATHAGTANIGVTISASSSGTVVSPVEGTANIGVTISATAIGTAISTHSGVASIQVNLSASAGASSYDPLTEVPDESGENNVMVLNGSPTFTTTAAIGTRSVDFDGSNDYGEVDDTFQSLIRSSNFSFSAWIQKDRIGGTGYNDPILALSSTSNTDRLGWSVSPTGYVSFSVVVDGDSRAIPTTTGTITSSSTWYHVVVTVGSNSNNYPDFKAYINGSLSSERTDQDLQPIDLSQYTSSNPLEVGRRVSPSSSSLFNGRIDDVSIWDKELSSTEVSNLYNSGSGTDLSGSGNLVGWWKMGDSNTITHSGTASCQVNLSASAVGFNTNTQVPDETSNNNDMVLFGGPSFTSDSAVGTRATDFVRDPTTGSGGPYDIGRIGNNYESVFQSPFSISMWVKPDDGQPAYAHDLFSTYKSGGSDEWWYYQIKHTTAGKIFITIVEKNRGGVSSSRASRKESTNAVFSDGSQSSYKHLVVTFDSSGIDELYVDGSSVALTASTVGAGNTAAISNYTTVSDYTYVGGFTYSDPTVTAGFNGKIDDVSLWSANLTSTQVSNLYNSGSGSSLTGSSDLEGWWKMGDHSVLPVTHSGTGTVSVDVTTSASGNAFTAHSGTASCQVNLSASASGTASTPVLDNDYAVSCDGTDDYIDLNSNFSSVFNSDFSVAFWINLPEGQPSGSGFGTGSNPNIFGLSNSGNAHRFFGLIGLSGASDAGKLRVYYKAGGTQVHARSASAFFSSGATGWVHVVVTVEEGSNGIKMYKNGSAVSVDEASNSMSSVTMSNFAGNVDMTFGASNRSGTPNYETDADFDEIAIFNTALSSTQVSTIYNSGIVYDLDGHSNLEGWWRMEEGSGTSVADSSSNSNTATLVNGPTFITNVP